MKIFLLSYLLLFFCLACQPKKTQKTTQKTTPPVKNVILLIGDGMGLTQMYLSMLQNEKPLPIEEATHIGLIKTQSADNLITDSAAGATAFATGKKTYNGAIAVDTEKQPLKTLLEMAEERNLATGLVATSEITHATPASFIAHQPDRDWHEKIAEDFLKTDIDIFVGGGKMYFSKRKDNKNLLDSLEKKGYAVCSSMEDFKNTNSKKIAGLLAEKAMPTMEEGRKNVMPQVVDKVLQVLNTDSLGFFLMIEGSQIDWAGHKNDADYLVEELADFHKVIEVVFSFVKKNPNTLVIITADHETGGLTLPQKDGDAIEPHFSTLRHTAVMVPVYAMGAKAALFSGIYENTDIFYKITQAYQW